MFRLWRRWHTISGLSIPLYIWGNNTRYSGFSSSSHICLFYCCTQENDISSLHFEFLWWIISPASFMCLLSTGISSLENKYPNILTIQISFYLSDMWEFFQPWLGAFCGVFDMHILFFFPTLVCIFRNLWSTKAFHFEFRWSPIYIKFLFLLWE